MKLVLTLPLAVVTLLAALLLANLGLHLLLFGVETGPERLERELRAVFAARAVETGETTALAAFRSLYPARCEADLSDCVQSENVQPAMFDATLAAVGLERYGAIDARTLPPGAYLAAGPIGPDGWPYRLLGALFFPRHGYLLIVPEPEGGAYPQAEAATASYRGDFRDSGNKNELYARVEDYRPSSFDFPRAGEPVHELYRLEVPLARLKAVRNAIGAMTDDIQEEGRDYRLLRRNSNSAMGCFLQAAGLTEQELRPLQRPLVRLRLPGVASARACPEGLKVHG